MSVCIDQLGLDQVYVIPSYQTPGKPLSKTSRSTRLEMTQRVFEKMPQVKVLENEIQRKKESYTIDTLNELSLSEESFLIIGDDLFFEMNQWKNFKEIISQVHLAVIVRSQEADVLKKDSRLDWIQKWVKKKTKEEWSLKTGKNIVFIKTKEEFKDVSSSMIRNKMKLGLPVHLDIPSVLANSIHKYYSFLKPLSQEGLYQDILEFLKDHGALDPAFFSFKQNLYDHIIVSGGRNTRHVRSLSDSLQEYIHNKYDVSPLHTEGEKLSQWIVLDYYVWMIHICLPSLREYYQLDLLWKKRSI